jgi:hypothetical protein
VKGFGCRPVVTYPRALGPASESPPGRNPREPHGRLFLRFGHRAWSCAGSRAQPWPARFQCPAGLEVGGDPGSAEGVAADLCGLEKIEPIHVALYIEELQQGFSKPRDIAFRRCEPNFALIYIKKGGSGRWPLLSWPASFSLSAVVLDAFHRFGLVFRAYQFSK